MPGCALSKRLRKYGTLVTHNYCFQDICNELILYKTTENINDPRFRYATIFISENGSRDEGNF